VAHLPDGADEAGIIAAARDRQVGLQGMSTFRASRAMDPPQLVIGFGDVADRAIEPGIAAIADLLA
jgi:GntR family transcriptional regulator / MocR family aminotransferase